MDQAAIDQVAYFTAMYFLMGVAVGSIMKMLIPPVP